MNTQVTGYCTVTGKESSECQRRYGIIELKFILKNRHNFVGYGIRQEVKHHQDGSRSKDGGALVRAAMMNASSRSSRD